MFKIFQTKLKCKLQENLFK